MDRLPFSLVLDILSRMLWRLLSELGLLIAKNKHNSFSKVKPYPLLQIVRKKSRSSFETTDGQKNNLLSSSVLFELEGCRTSKIQGNFSQINPMLLGIAPLKIKKLFDKSVNFFSRYYKGIPKN